MRVIWPSAAIIASFAYVAVANSAGANDWNFAATEEQWGRSCTLTSEKNGVEFRVLGMSDEDLIVFVNGHNHAEDDLSFRIEGNPAHILLPYTTGDYFGGVVAYQGFSMQLLNEMKGGTNMSLSTQSEGAVEFLLNNAGPAVDKFITCYSDLESAPDQSDEAQGQYLTSDTNIEVEAFGSFTKLHLQDRDFTDIGGKKIRKVFNNFSRSTGRKFLYEFDIKDRFRPLSNTAASEVNVFVENIHEDNSSIRSTVTVVTITRGYRGAANYSHTYFNVEQGECIENVALETNTSEAKTLICKGISTEGERFDLTFETDIEFQPKVTKSSAAEETRLADEEKSNEEERSRRETEYLRCLVYEGEEEKCEHLKK